MLNRRDFMVGTCAACHALSPSGARSQDGLPGEFICSTLDRVPSGEIDFSIINHSSSQERAEFESSIREFRVTPYGTSFLADRWRINEGLTPNTGLITLGVFFFDGTSTQRATFRDAARSWTSGPLSSRLAFTFDVEQARSQIRVTFQTNVNESYIGRDNLRIKVDQPTMWIAQALPHIIQHECGHAIGLQHEHQNPELPFRWKPKRVIEDMAARGWSEQKTINNILSRFNQGAACIGDPSFNRKSIMLYPIPREWTEGETFSSAENMRIDKRDLDCVRAIYRA